MHVDDRACCCKKSRRSKCLELSDDVQTSDTLEKFFFLHEEFEASEEESGEDYEDKKVSF